MLQRFDEDNNRLYSPAGLLRRAAKQCSLPERSTFANNMVALEQLCAALETARPHQTTLGKLHVQAILADAIGKSLTLADYLRRFPEISTTEIARPIFIAAPFRTGTTFLHRLLACDPQHRWPRLWEVAYPPPPEPELRGYDSYFTHDPRIAKARGALRALHRASPELAGLHPMAEDAAEECLGLLETSFLSHSFMFYADVPAYLEWLNNCGTAEWRAAYQTYAAQLRLLQWWYPGRRWVLKCPLHLWNLDMLQETFPDATIIQLHRDPAATMASFHQLLAAYHRIMCKTPSQESIDARARSYTQQAMDRAAAARSHSPAAHFIDIDFADLTRSPITTIEALYAQLGETLTPQAESAMRQFLNLLPVATVA